jgi:Protein of unknown function (DUF2568)
MIRQGFRGFNELVAFLLELCALAALGWWGVRAGGGPLAKTVLGIGAPLLAAVAWGLFAAPRAPITAPPAKLAVEVAVFGGATAGLYAIGQRWLALVFAILVVVNRLLIGR